MSNDQLDNVQYVILKNGSIIQYTPSTDPDEELLFQSVLEAIDKGVQVNLQ